MLKSSKLREEKGGGGVLYLTHVNGFVGFEPLTPRSRLGCNCCANGSLE